MTFVTALESPLDGTRFPPATVCTTHRDRPLLVRYDLDAVRAAVTPADIARRPPTMWRYRELLPVPHHAAVSLGETMTPLIPAPRLAADLGLQTLHIKDESRLPTASFKARGMAVAVSMARHLGLHRLVIPSAGNAACALAAYAARAGLRAAAFLPADTPTPVIHDCIAAGARTFLVNGPITDCARLARAVSHQFQWFDMSTLREPYRIEGKKTMAFELAEQLDWSLPDAIIYPTGGGTGLIAMAKAFDELATIGWIPPDRRPRLFAVQSDGCAPIVRAFRQNHEFAEPWDAPSTTAWGIRVPAAIGDFLILRAIRATGGLAVAVPENQIEPARQHATALEGIPFCPETAACLLALRILLRDAHLRPDDHVVIFNTGSPTRYTPAGRPPLPALDPDTPPDILTDLA